MAEIYNSRYDARVINSWLQEPPSGSLHVFRSFVGKLIKAFAHRSNISEIISGTVTAPMTGSSTNQPAALPSLPASPKPILASLKKPETPTDEDPFDALLDFLKQTIGVEQCVIYTYDKDSDLLWARDRGTSETICPTTEKYGENLIGRSTLSGEPMLYSTRGFSILGACDDVVRVDEIPSTYLTAPEQEETDTLLDLLCIPTFDGNRIVNGAVLLRNKVDKLAFNLSDVAMSVNICRHIGNVLCQTELHDAIQRAQGKAQTLLDLSAVLFRELETNSLLIAIMDAIKKPMNAAKCSMFLMNDDKTELVTPIGSDISCDMAQEVFRNPVTSGIIGAAASSGQIINVRDAYSDPRFNREVDRTTGFATRSILAVPIKDANGEVLGVLEMVNKLGKQYFDKEDEVLAKGIAYYLAIALHNARLFEEARSAMRRSDALLAMMQVMSSTNENVGDVFTALIETACQILNIEHGTLFFVDSLSNTLFCRVGVNWKGYTIPMGKFVQGIVAERGEIQSLVNASSHADFDQEYDKLVGIETKSVLCVPVKAARGDQVIAVFYAVNKAGKPSARFCDEDIKIMRAICNEMSSIIERRAWELLFENADNTETHVTSSFLAQYTTTPIVSRRRTTATQLTLENGSLPSHPSSTSLSEHDRQAAAMIASATQFPTDAVDPATASRQNAHVICSWTLDPWEHTLPQLVDLVVDMFTYYDLLQRFDVPKATMRRFVVGVKAQYQDIPYHSFYHAFSTLHMSFMLVTSQCPMLDGVATPALTSSSAIVATGTAASRNLFESRDLMAIFVAAFCHDMNHNGRTNDFHIRYRTSIAMLYNDQSVLENMHAAACFDTMRRPGHDILEHTSPEAYRYIRKSIIRAILATDMHNHAAIVTQLHEKLTLDAFNSEDDTHKELLINAIVHSADISGPALSEELHFRWAHRLLLEFNMQYDEELALGMSPTPYMNARPGSLEICKLNLAFIDSCVFPLWSIMSTFLDGLEGCMANIQTNRTAWTTQLETFSSSDKPEPSPDKA